MATTAAAGQKKRKHVSGPTTPAQGPVRWGTGLDMEVAPEDQDMFAPTSSDADKHDDSEVEKPDFVKQMRHREAAQGPVVPEGATGTTHSVLPIPGQASDLGQAGQAPEFVPEVRCVAEKRPPIITKTSIRAAKVVRGVRQPSGPSRDGAEPKPAVTGKGSKRDAIGADDNPETKRKRRKVKGNEGSADGAPQAGKGSAHGKGKGKTMRKSQKDPGTHEGNADGVPEGEDVGKPEPKGNKAKAILRRRLKIQPKLTRAQSSCLQLARTRKRK